MRQGWNWYQQGKALNKRNTFLDFIACAEFLIQKKYTEPSKLSIYGRSAGNSLQTQTQTHTHTQTEHNLKIKHTFIAFSSLSTHCENMFFLFIIIGFSFSLF
jgi:hypothetical protein